MIRSFRDILRKRVVIQFFHILNPVKRVEPHTMFSPNELGRIVETAEEGFRRGLRSALATVVSIAGSSYRRPGARLLAREDGEVVGCTSGGCLERDVIRKCRLAMLENRARLAQYDTVDADDEGFGLGCRGEIGILVEPVSEHSLHFNYLQKIRSLQKPSVLVTCYGETRLDFGPGVLALFQSGHLAYHSALAPELLEYIYRHSAQCLLDARTRTCEHAVHQLQFLFEYVAPAPKLVIFGAGPEMIPLASCACTLGYRVLVVDERPGTISRIRRVLPEAVKCCSQAAPGVLRQIEYPAGAACIVATHNMSYDQRALEAAIAAGVAYIGLLGPKQRALQITECLLRTGCNAAGLRAVRAPVGLDIGAETPEHIALSILAEIQAVGAERNGGFLRERTAPIHDRNAPESERAAA